MSRVMDAIRRANETRQPEDSLVLRGVVLGAVMTAALALVAEEAVDLSTGAALLVALPVAYWISYKRRRKDNWQIKIGLTVGAIFALFAFLQQLSGVATLDEVRFPLASLFLWVQVLHGFDLPARKDLNFSLGSSLTLMAVAGSISQDLKIAFFLIVYLGFVIAALILSHRSEINDRAHTWALVPRTGKAERPRGGFPLRDVGRAVLATAVAGALMFLVIPQGTSARTIGLPFSVGDGLGAFSGGGISNPGFSGDPASRSSATSYYGFSDRMDLRVRGDLSDTLVMRVRSSAPSMWRALLFDRYDGVVWTGDSTEPEELGETPPYAYPIEFRSLGPRQTISQTFYIEQEQANVIFTGGQPDVVYIQDALSIDRLGALRTDSTLGPGTVYSAISTRGAATPKQLRALPPAGSAGPLPANLQPYLQVPSTLPERVETLARRITRDADNDFDRVKAIEAYLRDNFLYSLESPVPPPGSDAVDHFLFETDVGYCEQFASATAIMLRTLGIPTRVVVGYTPGERNPFTGYHEVRASDAHSWVDVWFPQVGWYEFDPTFDIPPARTELADVFPLAKVLRGIATVMASIIPDGGLGSLQGLLGTALVVTAVAALWLARDRWRGRRVAPRPALDAAAGPVTRALARLETVARGSGRGRRPAETAAEWLRRTYSARSSFALQVFEEERYGPIPPGEPETRAAVEELDRLTGSIGSHPA